MRRGSIRWTTALILATCVCEAADPSLWDVAREPRLARDIAALRDAERAFLQARSMAGPSATALLHETVRILERVDAASSPDVRVRFFFGRSLSRIDQDERAVTVLREAIVLAPNHPSVGEARFVLAVALARLGRTHEEIRTYQDWLEHEPSREQRTIGLSNLAEGLMAAGRIEEAVRSYREAIDLAHDNALAHWGLAVALDRSGDPAGAMYEAGIALTYDPDAAELDSPNVFFIPAHDRFWYHALGAMSRARSATSPALQASWWERGALYWQQYLDAAPIDDRWIAVARLRQAYCQKESVKVRPRARGR
jgi:tetratricopeptide (TPR) repeat protein